VEIRGDEDVGIILSKVENGDGDGDHLNGEKL
jgi:hypothetical protein